VMIATFMVLLQMLEEVCVCLFFFDDCFGSCFWFVDAEEH